MLTANVLVRRAKKTGNKIWQHLPTKVQEGAAASYLSHCIHAFSRKYSARRECEAIRYPITTRFLRYPPLLLTINDIINDCQFGDTVRLCVMGCSTGAELYSILWSIRSAHADLKIRAIGVDLSKSAIEKASTGRYSSKDKELTGLSEELRSELFDKSQAGLKIKESLAAEVKWVVGDVGNDDLRARLGSQDIVVANNFLVFLKEAAAAACLRKIVRWVRPGGLLLCRGVDLDVRERIAREFALQPIPLRIQEIHDVNPRERHGWPWEYWGLEPLDKTRKDWIRRYATVFQVPSSSHASTTGAVSDERYAVVAPIHCKQL